jgi:hypothetical protein
MSHLEAEPLREITAWLVDYRSFWDESYARLDALLATLRDEQQDRSPPGDR